MTAQEDYPRSLCSETLELFKANDPSLTNLSVSWSSEGISGDENDFVHRVDWSTAGPCLAENTHLKQLSITYFALIQYSSEATYDRSMDGWAHFCEGVSRNRSVEHLCISQVNAVVAKTLIERLSPLLEHSRNLRRLELSLTLVSSEMGEFSPLIFTSMKGNVAALASALAKCAGKSSLEELCIDTIYEGCCTDCKMPYPWGTLDGKCKGKAMGEKKVCELIGALKGHQNLTKVVLNQCKIGIEGCHALGKLLQSGECNIAELSLEDNNIDDECIDVLTKALASSSLFQHLDLRRNGSVTSCGWHAFFTSLPNSNVKLAGLNLQNNNIDDAAITAFAEWLHQPSNTLRYHDLDCNKAITPRGWLAFFRSLKNQSTLEELHLDYNSIDDEAAICLANALPNSLRKLYFCFWNIRSITTRGWQSLSAILQHETTELEYLSVGPLGDQEEFRAFAAALSGNKSLLTLDVYTGLVPTSKMTPFVCDVLCDRSSIDATFASNHTLQEFARAQFVGEPLQSYLEMNRNPNKSQVARQKILRHHFSGDNVANFELFLEMGMSELSQAVAWMGRDDAGFFLLHRLVCCMPALVERKSTNAAGAKRAREE